jgi:hypothetical protein
VGSWFQENILDTGRLPLFCFLAAFVLTFGFIRFSVRMIRAEVSWWPGNITPGGLHIHHVVFGAVAMVVGGVAALAVPLQPVVWRVVCAALFGIGTALVLDEFALILHLEDVYWSEEGRLSVDAVAVAAGLTGILVLGGVPLLSDLTTADDESPLLFATTVALVLAVNLALAVVTLLKGKVWTGLFGLFAPVLLLIGALRVARPQSIWARTRYHTPVERPGRPDKMARAIRREQRFHEPVQRLKVVIQDAVAGAPSRPSRLAAPAAEIAEDQARPGALDRTTADPTP